jgi:hypothetical protein
MAPKPLFNQRELEAAFQLILPPAIAAQCASQWFSEIAGSDALDQNGYFLYEDWHEAAGIPDDGRDVIAFRDPAVTEEQRIAGEAAYWGGLSIDDRIRLVMRFSDFHLTLLALVSDALFDRMRLATGMTRPQAETNRAQMQRRVAAIRAGM